MKIILLQNTTVLTLGGTTGSGRWTSLPSSNSCKCTPEINKNLVQHIAKYHYTYHHINFIVKQKFSCILVVTICFHTALHILSKKVIGIGSWGIQYNIMSYPNCADKA